MFHLGNSAEVNREQQADRLRKAEQERLAQAAMAAKAKSAAWQNVRKRLAELIEKQQNSQTGDSPTESYAFGEG